MRKKNKHKKKKILKRTILFIVLDVLALLCFFIMYGPFDYFRNLYVSTAMNTMDHQWLARIFFSDETIEKIMSSNYFITINEDANTDDIVIDTSEKKKYKDKYEKELLTREPGNDLYKVLSLKVGGSDAKLVAIYKPEKVRLISTEQFNVGTYGERIITMCERYGGVVCINGGGFVDNGLGSDIPLGYVIQDGKITWSDNTRANIIGMTKDGKLKLLTNTTGEEAIKKGVVDGLTFSPFLIVNGKELEIVGDPWGSSPRMAIAQRKDGVMMFLSIDGENYINGATLQDTIDVLKRYGAYNAANLDGGASTVLAINGVTYNNPVAQSSSGERSLPNAWIVK